MQAVSQRLATSLKVHFGGVNEVFIWPNYGSPPSRNMREHTRACKANPLRVLGIFRRTRASQMEEICNGG